MQNSMERGAGAGSGAGAGYSSSEDEGGYGAEKELDARISSYPPLWWLVLAHLLIVGFPEGGKTPCWLAVEIPDVGDQRICPACKKGGTARMLVVTACKAGFMDSQSVCSPFKAQLGYTPRHSQDRPCPPPRQPVCGHQGEG